MRKVLIGAVFSLMMLFGVRAHAAAGYPCFVEYMAQSGYVGVGLYSGSACTGTFQGFMIFPSASFASGIGCQASYSEAALWALQQTFRSAYQSVSIYSNAASNSYNTQCALGYDLYLK